MQEDKILLTQKYERAFLTMMTILRGSRVWEIIFFKYIKTLTNKIFLEATPRYSCKENIMPSLFCHATIVLHLSYVHPKWVSESLTLSIIYYGSALTKSIVRYAQL